MLAIGIGLISTVPAAALGSSVIEIGVPMSIDIGTAVSIGLTPPGSATPEYIPFGLLGITNWPTQTADLPDPTTVPTNKITLRLQFLIQSVRVNNLVSTGGIGCVSVRGSNPTSDHPLGRACDLMYSYPSPAGIESGWRTANWLIANQAVLGVKYVIWQGKIWNASTRPGPWTTYFSSAYGCPNPANVTGCHYDHVHVSVY